MDVLFASLSAVWSQVIDWAGRYFWTVAAPVLHYIWEALVSHHRERAKALALSLLFALLVDALRRQLWGALVCTLRAAATMLRVVAVLFLRVGIIAAIAYCTYGYSEWLVTNLSAPVTAAPPPILAEAGGDAHGGSMDRH